MNNKFDELTKGMAQSVTRRAALKKLGIGLAGIALACFGLPNIGQAGKRCATDADCRSGQVCCNGYCTDDGRSFCTPGDRCCCYRNRKFCGTKLPSCDPLYNQCDVQCALLFC